MAKRFTDTEKWKKQSFGDLSIKLKLVWIYLCDNCDHCGVWDVNLKLLSFHLGESVTLSEIEASFGDKITWLGKAKIFIPAFIEFQYGALNQGNRVHSSVLNRLEKLGACKPRVSPVQGAKDKDKDKAKDMDKEKEKEKENNRVFVQPENPEQLVSSLPLKIREAWIFEYSEDWLWSEMKKCFDYYAIENPEKKPRTSRGWRSAATGWIRRSKFKILKGQDVASGSICGRASV